MQFAFPLAEVAVGLISGTTCIVVGFNEGITSTGVFVVAMGLAAIGLTLRMWWEAL